MTSTLVTPHPWRHKINSIFDVINSVIDAEPVQQSLSWPWWAWLLATVGIAVTVVIAAVGDHIARDLDRGGIVVIALTHIPYMWLMAAVMRHLPERAWVWWLFVIICLIYVLLASWEKIPGFLALTLCLASLPPLMYDGVARQIASIPLSWAMIFSAFVVAGIVAIVAWLKGA